MTLDGLIQNINGLAFRVVEDQEEVATLEIVDNIDEQVLLEQILEASKPPLKVNHPDYLISSPFRYPPLSHGSRFGGRYDNSLFYGSLSAHTALAETAYYRFLFWSGIVNKPINTLKTSHTLFQVNYNTDYGAKLQSSIKWQKKLTDPTDYSFTKQTGAAMRELGIEGFEFASARDKQKGINVAFFNPKPIRSKHALNKEIIRCFTNDNTVSFKQNGSFNSWSFTIKEFYADGKLAVVH